MAESYFAPSAFLTPLDSDFAYDATEFPQENDLEVIGERCVDFFAPPDVPADPVFTSLYPGSVDPFGFTSSEMGLIVSEDVDPSGDGSLVSLSPPSMGTSSWSSDSRTDQSPSDGRQASESEGSNASSPLPAPEEPMRRPPQKKSITSRVNDRRRASAQLITTGSGRVRSSKELLQERRLRKLERNRESASRSRLKKKHEIERTSKQARHLEDQVVLMKRLLSTYESKFGKLSPEELNPIQTTQEMGTQTDGIGVQTARSVFPVGIPPPSFSFSSQKSNDRPVRLYSFFFALLIVGFLFGSFYPSLFRSGPLSSPQYELELFNKGLTNVMRNVDWSSVAVRSDVPRLLSPGESPEKVKQPSILDVRNVTTEELPLDLIVCTEGTWLTRRHDGGGEIPYCSGSDSELSAFREWSLPECLDLGDIPEERLGSMVVSDPRSGHENDTQLILLDLLVLDARPMSPDLLTEYTGSRVQYVHL